jgi:hypothetical protein
VLHRTQTVKALAAAAILLVAACHGGSSVLPPAGVPQDASAIPDKKPAIKLTPAKLAFTAAGKSAAKTIEASEAGYTGAFKLASTCGKAVTIAPKKAKGPKAKLTVTPVSNVAKCTLTVSDTKKNEAVATISVTLTGPTPTPSPTPAPPALNVNPATLSFDATGASYAQTFAVTQTGTGAFKENDTCASIATVTSASWSAPSATGTVTPLAAGTCTVTITDSYNQIKTVGITVTTSGIIIQ